jgi:hypothetical protein
MNSLWMEKDNSLLHLLQRGRPFSVQPGVRTLHEGVVVVEKPKVKNRWFIVRLDIGRWDERLLWGRERALRRRGELCRRPSHSLGRPRPLWD